MSAWKRFWSWIDSLSPEEESGLKQESVTVPRKTQAPQQAAVSPSAGAKQKPAKKKRQGIAWVLDNDSTVEDISSFMKHTGHDRWVDIGDSTNLWSFLLKKSKEPGSFFESYELAEIFEDAILIGSFEDRRVPPVEP